METHHQDVEIPEYFICPISLQMMKDPVTTVSGITYDRESIERWLSKSQNTTCPLTNQPLPRDSCLTPNHTLHRLIQAWCTTNASHGVSRVSAPKPSIDNNDVMKLLRDLEFKPLQARALKRLEELALRNLKNSQHEFDKSIMLECGVPKAMISLITRCVKENSILGIEEALRILYLVWSPTPEIRNLVQDNSNFIDSLTWIMSHNSGDDHHELLKINAIKVLKNFIEASRFSLLERLNLEFFITLVKCLRDIRSSQQGIKSALQVLIEACPWGRNRLKIIESDAVFELIDLELEKPEKRVTELIFNLLANLCSCADGRAQLLKHAGGIAMISKRTLRVSTAVDDQAMKILGLVAKFSGTKNVLIEMLRVGAVSKLCMVLQADCEGHLKNKARSVLRLHSNVWNNSPCIQVYLLTRHPAR